MILAHMRNAAGAGDNFRLMNLFAMSYEDHRNTEEEFNFRGSLCKAKVSSEEKIKVFGKSTVAIHSLILRSTEVDLFVYVM